jgi:hypothetical protein
MGRLPGFRFYTHNPQSVHKSGIPGNLEADLRATGFNMNHNLFTASHDSFDSSTMTTAEMNNGQITYNVFNGANSNPAICDFGTPLSAAPIGAEPSW